MTVCILGIDPGVSGAIALADRRRNLVKAGALILAELDRDDYARKRKGA